MDFDLNVLRRIDEKNSYIVIEEDSMMDPIVKPRKRRLDHLTWEEKIQRKKLKNRVAAQTSRDRKKAKMEQLEVNFERLMAQNQRVLAECENLKKLNDKLRAENKELQQRTMRQPCPNCNHPQAQSRPVECGDYLSGSTESEDLLQQGVVTHSAAALPTMASSSSNASPQITSLLKILLACLICKTSSTSSSATRISAIWTSSPRAFSQISPPTLMQLVKALNCKTQLVDPVTLEKWWGRHQNSWNPMGAMLAI